MDESIEISAQPKRRRVKWIILLAASLLVAAGVVVLILVLVNHDSGPGASDPMKLVKKFIRAVEEEDVDAYVDCYDPDGIVAATPLAHIKEGLGEEGDSGRSTVEAIFEALDIDFKGVTLLWPYEQDDFAGAIIFTGILEVTSEEGTQTRYLLWQPFGLHMVIKDGRYYMDPNVLISWDTFEVKAESEENAASYGLLEDFDFSGIQLEDFDMEDISEEELREMFRETFPYLDEELINKWVEEIMENNR